MLFISTEAVSKLIIMRKLFCIYLLAMSAFTAKAQDYQNEKIDLYVRVQNNSFQPSPYVDISIIDKESNVKQIAVTDKKGNAKFVGARGKTYSINFNDFPNYSEVTVPLKGLSFITKTVIYTSTQASSNIKEIPVDTIVQKFTTNDVVGPNEVEFIIQIEDMDKNKLKNLKIRLFAKKFNKTYVATTDASGCAYFFLPPGVNINISMEELENFEQMSLPDQPLTKLYKTMYYVPTIVDESVRNDTVYQKLPSTVNATSSRAYVRVLVRNLDAEPLQNEMVLLDVKGTKKVFKAVTNERGVAEFLLPKGSQFTLNFLYERDIDLLDYPNRQYLQTTKIEYNYRGSENIRSFYKTAKRDASGFRTEFEEGKIEPKMLDNENYLEKTDVGYNINLPSQSATSTPTVFDDNLFVNGGYYTPDLYNFDSKSGRYKWGVKFLESGPSTAVYEDGVILVNTQSCTLYAIEAKSGKLLWSKWLGSSIYTTPTVADGLVYAIYPNDLDRMFKFVIVAFVLKTGAVKWQNWIDSEALACPVVYNKNVYLTTMLGTLYMFDGTNGKQLHVENNDAVSPPTIASNFLYVGLKSKSEQGKQEIALYDSKTLRFIRRVKNVRGNLQFDDAHNMSADRLMSYDGCRIMHYKGKNFAILGGKLFCISADGEVLWTKDVGDDCEINKTIGSPMPVIANGKLIVSKKTGEIQIYNAANGNLLKEFKTNAILYLQPTVYDGWIYSGSQNGKTIAIDTKDKTITGWSQWGNFAAHNTTIE